MNRSLDKRLKKLENKHLISTKTAKVYGILERNGVVEFGVEIAEVKGATDDLVIHTAYWETIELLKEMFNQ